MTREELARQLYRPGETTIAEVAKELRASRHSIGKILHAAGVKMPPKNRDHVQIGEPPDPKPCSYKCGRLATSWNSSTCLPCALTPPCGCKEGGRPVRRYGGRWQCRKCQLLMGRVG